MEKLIKPGRVIFSIGIIGLAVLCIIMKDFIIGRPPGWDAGSNPIVGLVSGVGLILAAIAIILRWKPGVAALLIAASIFLIFVLRILPNFMTDWLNGFKSLALSGGALIVACSFFKEDARITSTTDLSESWRKRFVVTGSVLLAVFFIACGYAHFKFADFVINFIPAYIPFRPFWTYFCGICLVAGGIGILIPPTAKLAALLSGIMILGWFLLLHIPRFIANTNDLSDRLGLCESFTLVGVFVVLAGILAEQSRVVTVQSAAHKSHPESIARS